MTTKHRQTNDSVAIYLCATQSPVGGSGGSVEGTDAVGTDARRLAHFPHLSRHSERGGSSSSGGEGVIINSQLCIESKCAQQLTSLTS